MPSSPKDLYGLYKTVFHLFNEWSESGLLETIFEEIAEISDRTQIQIDSTISRAHQSSAGKKGGSKSQEDPLIGMIKGGKSTKTHLVINTTKATLGWY